jgi:hypothetical protein
MRTMKKARHTGAHRAFQQSQPLVEQGFDDLWIRFRRDPFDFLAILEQQDYRPHRGLVAGLERRLRVKVQTEEGVVFVGRFLPQFVERQDLALADRSPRGVEVNDDGFAAGDQLVEIRLFEDVEFNTLGGSRGHCSQKHQQGQSLQDA